ncbi:MAG: extracellular solute-binding protein [Clostridiaceae bacterium]|nr:extracellular solute-binding protein [Clostridiaceae bacterium]
MKRKAILCLLLILSMLLVSACDGKTPETTKPAAKDPVTIRLAVWGGEARFKLYDQVFALYTTENPHVTLQKEYLAWSDYWVKKATQAAGNNLPDMTNVSWYSIREYADKGMYVPLQPYVDSGVIKTDGFLDLVLDTGKVDGVLYALPIGVSIDGLMHNKTLIESVGMEPPSFEISYEDFTDYVLELQSKLPDNIWAITDQGRDQKVAATYIRQKFGVEFYSDDGKALGFTKENLKDWMNWWQVFRDAGAVVPAEITAELEGGDPWADTVQAREWVCLWSSPDNQLTIYQLYAEGEIGIGRWPFNASAQGNKWGEILLTTAFAIATNSNVKDDVAHLVNWFPYHIEGNRIFNADQGFVGVPEVVDMLKQKWTESEPQKVEFFNHANAVATSNPPVPPTVPWATGHTAVVSAFERQYDEVRYGNKTIDQMVDDFFAEAETLLANK